MIKPGKSIVVQKEKINLVAAQNDDQITASNMRNAANHLQKALMNQKLAHEVVVFVEVEQ
jgi:hypothetical protein